MKTLLLITLFVVSSMSLYAQSEKKTDIYISAGAITLPQIATGIGDVLGGAISGQPIDKNSGTGALTLGINHFVSERVSVGVLGTWEKITSYTKNRTENFSWTSTALMANARFYYINKNALHLYSGASIGYALLKSSSNEKDGALAFQIDALGIRLGSRVGILGEVGFGYQGLAKVGASIRL